MKKKIIIQIPCLNEESTIGKVIKDLKKVFKRRNNSLRQFFNR